MKLQRAHPLGPFPLLLLLPVLLLLLLLLVSRLEAQQLQQAPRRGNE